MSTYSSNLRLELITTGTQAGTWGSTTNTNLGTLLEGAVSGYSTVSVTSANQAFTANNGAADEARQALINLTTTTTANFAVYAPPVSKQYVIYNSSAYTATIYNSTVTGNTTAAGTGIAVLAGLTMTVWSNGTNFYSQNTQLISPTIASPTMTGTPVAPTATAGTNTTQVATTAFVQTNGTPAGSILMWGSATPPTNWLLCNTSTAISRTTYATLFAVIGTTYGVGDGSTTFNLPNFNGSMPIGVTAATSSTFTGSIATTTLTVTAVATGALAINQVITGTGITSGTTITGFVSGTFGGIGVYTVSVSQTVSSTSITGAQSAIVLASTGGAATTSIATANLPSHSHTQSGTFTSGAMSANSTHTHSYYNSGGNGPDGYITRSYGNINSPSLNGSNPTGSPPSGIDYADISHTHTVTISGSTATTGSGTAVTTISPYLSMYFIIKYI